MGSSFNRRQFLKVSAGSLLAAGLWPGCTTPKAQQQVEALKPVKFIEVNDLHFSDDNCIPYFEKLVKELNTHDGIACCLVVGDLADEGKATQFSTISAILAKVKAPIKTVIGNHDYVDKQDRSTYLAAYPTGINGTFVINGWRFIGLDSSDSADGQKYDGVTVSSDTTAYIKNTLRTIDKAQPLIIYTHFPLGKSPKYRLTNADATLDLFRDHNVQGIFNGHWHGYSVADFKGAQVTTNCCCSRKRDNHDGTKPKGYFICAAGPAGVTRTFVEFTAPKA